MSKRVKRVTLVFTNDDDPILEYIIRNRSSDRENLGKVVRKIIKRCMRLEYLLNMLMQDNKVSYVVRRKVAELVKHGILDRLILGGNTG